MRSADLELDLDVFAGPFDLLLAIVLREEISLLEVELGEVVLAYLARLEEAGELDLEAATEFLVLIAALLELKSRMMLPAAEAAELDLGPEEAADELLARMLEYRRYKDAGADLSRRFEQERPYLYRSAPLPLELRRVSLAASRQAYDPDRLGVALGDLLSTPPVLDTSHIRPTVSLERRLVVLRELLSRSGRVDFDEAFGGDDRITQAVTIFALLELYKEGEASWNQRENFGAISISGGSRASADGAPRAVVS
ncbi:MAG: segregation/condensation protein A [Solirubrobacterales bacterium]|nr:segregation/condensation protein A [Solirubrobacterales bacterium]